MPLSRRRFFGNSAALTATAAASQIELAWAGLAEGGLAQSGGAPSPEVIALHRMGFGPRPGDIARVRSIGLTAYIDEQLAPNKINDSACDAKIAAARMRLRDGTTTELLPLQHLGQATPQLWALRERGYNRYQRPFREVRAAMWIRAVHSKRQLYELLVDFWHNHFNVNASSDSAISATFPVYDRMIRANCLGNFRTFLEQVAKSTAMLYYLDNVSNKAGGGEGGNENFARELFELHTLGSDNYLKFYDDREQIGTITYGGKTYARGYVDDDVYEASRCLTGWTIANNHWELPDSAPNTGEFYYYKNWHDTNPKIVLSTDGRNNIPRNQADLKDAQMVFDLLAGHPGTARHLCTKLARRLIADDPPATVVDAAVATWMSNLSAPDQLRKVVRVILTSEEFRTTWGRKVKRPFEAVAAYLRATNAEFSNDTLEDGYWDSVVWQFSSSGHRLFEWATPTGHPDEASYWASTNGMLRRWNLPYALSQSWGGNVKIDLKGQTNMNQSCVQIVDFWIARLCGFTINPQVRQGLIAFMAQSTDAAVQAKPPKPLSGSPDWNNADALTDRLNCMVQLLAMSPDFHTR